MNYYKRLLEKYYPEEFQKEVKGILSLDHDAKWKEKRKLFDEVIEWIKENEKNAKKEFEKSADEIIGILKKIGKKIGLANK